MKKIIATIVLCLVLGMSAQAQWTSAGVKVGIGYSTYTDDLRTDHGIFGFNFGGFAEYSFTQSNSFILENLSLHFGLNLIRRGYVFEDVYEHGLRLSVTDGFTHAWYAQIPVLVRYKYELPIKKAGHYLTVQLGPAFSMGLFGNFRERKISPQMPQEGMNYDTYVTEPKEARHVFRHIRRPDVNIIFGLGYEHEYWAVDVFLDYGFLATSLSPDRVKELEQQEAKDHPVTPKGSNDNNNNNNEPNKPIDPDKMRTKMPNGNNISVMASLTYRIPLGKRR